MRNLLLSALIILGLGITGLAQKLTPDSVIGDWTGESKCQGSNTFCRDEVVLYHFTRIGDKAEKVHLAADKLVTGKWELMSEMDFTIDPRERTLTTEFPIPRTGGRGTLTLTVVGDKMDGVMMIYPENEIGRKIHVDRKKN